MPHPRNLEAAQGAIETYEDVLGESGARDEKEGIVDLITDLFHLADASGLRVHKLLETAKMHYEEEAGPIEEGRRRR
jgi:hypothetical protein